MMEFKFTINSEEAADKAIETIKKLYCCNGCKHYYRHYLREKNGRFTEIYIGHCVGTSHSKIRKPDDVCDLFERKDEE